MSILIRGMEMPSNCAECPLNHDAECAVKNCIVIDDCYVRRAFWCPLVPAANVRPVVLCRDCKNYIERSGACAYLVVGMREDDFCSYGKKREES